MRTGVSGNMSVLLKKLIGKLKEKLKEKEKHKPQEWREDASATTLINLMFIGSQLEAEKKRKGDEEVKEKILNILKLYNPSSILGSDTYENRLKELSEAIKKLYGTTIEVQIRTLSPLSIGTSEGLGYVALEVGLSFDPLLNLPYIPGSSIKGAMRTAADGILRKEVVETLFGTKTWPGTLIVLDAYPSPGVDIPVVVPHVITPHYQVPGGSVELERDAKPTPVHFLVVPPGVTFEVIMGLRADEAIAHLDKLGMKVRKEELIEAIKHSLGVAVRDYGLGARTAAGFSFFEVLKEQEG